MPSKEELREQLVDKLEELFQLDQPELDFGFYRIMHAKADEVERYLQEDLPRTLEDALGEMDDKRLREYEEAYAEAVKDVEKTTGIDDPNVEDFPKLRDQLNELEGLRSKFGDRTEHEADVYEHLYRFFERYYDRGDFISRRYRVRETDSRAAPYAIPYNGEEVKLHWANHDQYYIKTGEYFSNFSFDLRRAKEVEEKREQGELGFAPDKDTPLRVHFRVVDAEEGEHNNTKANDNKVRKFQPYLEKPVELNDADELVVNFESTFKNKSEYIYDKSAERRTKERFYSRLRKSDIGAHWVSLVVFDHLDELDIPPEYKILLSLEAPTEKQPTRPLLAKYYRQFVAKNTMDYFIHQDLHGFLKRELDFYIKNEVMQLDDIESADAPRVESYLDKIKAIRTVAQDIINFLSQFEDFQRKLFEKRKFVVQAEYCLTLNNISEGLLDEIADQEAQLQHWELPLDTTASDLAAKKNELVLDTALCRKGTKQRILASIDDLSSLVSGVAIHAEATQALRLSEKRFSGLIKCAYIDPPYNTKNTDFLYKDHYKHSTWLTFIKQTVENTLRLQRSDGVLFCTIDDNEGDRLSLLRNSISPEANIPPFFVQVRYREKTLAEDMDFQKLLERVIVFPRKDFEPIKPSEDYSYDKFCWYVEEKGPGRRVEIAGKDVTIFEPEEYEIREGSPSVDGLKEVWASGTILDINSSGRFFRDNLAGRVSKEGLGALYKVPGIGADVLEYRYFTGPKRAGATKGKYYQGVPKSKRNGESRELTISNFFDMADAFGNCRHEGGVDFRSGKKPEKFVSKLLEIGSSQTEMVLDCFLGSGTTAAVAQKMNRPWVGVEQGVYFETKVIPRLKRVLAGEQSGVSEDYQWEGGGMFQYLRLESYEDTLNNLKLGVNEKSKAAKSNDDLRKDYLLNYMLEVETQGSPSLLNIDEFSNPTSYKLEVKKPGSMAREETTVDLLETFNYLIGLRVQHIAAPESFDADFRRPEDPELPEDQHTKLEIDGKMQATEQGAWWFRTVTGWVPSDSMRPHDSERQNVLIVWRKLTDDREKDNAVLDAYVEKKRINPQDFEFDTIYVNGSNNLPNLRREDEAWKVRSLEKEFMERMWDVDNV